MLPLMVPRLVFSTSSAGAFSLFETDRLDGDVCMRELREFIPLSFIGLSAPPLLPRARPPTGLTVPKSQRSSSSLLRAGESS